jgi:acetyltransferase-like isoleucine patch superfamily enzyme
MKQAVKILFHSLFVVATFPMALMCGFGRWYGAFTFFAQLCALAPGLPGDFLRIAFYTQTLDRCTMNARISQGSFFVNPRVHLGEMVYIGAYCILGPCKIGDRCLIASFVQIMPGRRQHPRRADGTLEAHAQGTPITVGQDCWIGASAIVMEDVGEKSTVAAGAIVTRPVAPGATVAGNPARVLQPRAVPE